MTKNKIYHIKDYIFFLGVPARKLAVGLSATSPRSAALHCGLFATIPNAN